MISLTRNLVFYLVAWLCLSGFLVPFSIVAADGSSSSSSSSSSCPCFPPVGVFKTYDQSSYADANSPVNSILRGVFATLFPRGLTIGANVFLNLNGLLCSVLGTVLGILDAVLDLVFTTVDQVVAFLPQVGNPGALVAGVVNPTSQEVANALAGNTLALALNVALDLNVATFSTATSCNLTNLYVVHGPCAGLSVAAVLNIANQLLGNTCPPPLLGNTALTIAANINLCVASINENFLAGAVANNYLALPGLNLQAIVDVCLALPAITADVGATLVVKGLALGAPLSVQLNVGAQVTTFKAWRLDTTAIPASSPLSVAGLVLPLPSVVSGLLATVVSLVDGLLAVVLDDTLCLVNYLLNNKPINATVADIQAAIILLLNPGLTIQALLQLGFTCNPQLVLAILADVRLNGAGFVPASGQIVGVVADVDIAGIAAKVLLELNLPILGLNAAVDVNLCPAL